jgi:hypothetical protein
MTDHDVNDIINDPDLDFDLRAAVERIDNVEVLEELVGLTDDELLASIRASNQTIAEEIAKSTNAGTLLLHRRRQRRKEGLH